MARYQNKDDEHLAALQDYYARWRSLPSYERMCELLDFATKSAVAKLLRRLQEAGYLDRTPDDVWIPTSRFFERPHWDIPVRAGHPAEVVDAREERMVVDEYLVEKPSATCLLTVKGDSMVQAGILEGDRVLVEQRQDARVGQIVVAMVDGEYTVKTLGMQRGRPVLLPANPDYAPIKPKGALEIFGVVVGLVRKYGR